MVAFQFFQNQNFVRKKIGRKCVKPVAKGEKKLNTTMLVSNYN